MKWDDTADTQLLYIINDYESLFRDPLNYGVYKLADTELLMQGWLDQQDLIFTWEKQLFDDGSSIERPVIGSNKQVFGALKDLVQILRDNAPTDIPAALAYDPAAFQRRWERQDLGGRLAIPQVPGAVRDVFGAPGVPDDPTDTTTGVTFRIDSYQWRAVVVEWSNSNPLELIFIINNYESFFQNPLANGVYKYVERDLLLKNWIDRQDLIFTWERVAMADGTVTEAPVVGSHKEVYGALKDILKTLRDNAP